MRISPAVSLPSMAKIISRPYVGNENHMISGINEIHMVQPGDLTFVDVPKYYRKALESKATTILINQQIDPPEGKALIISDNPFTDFNRLTEYFRPTIELSVCTLPNLGQEVSIGQQVVCGENVHIGSFTEIGHHVTIGSHVKIGKRCKIHPGVMIRDYVELGDDVCIQSGTILGGEAFYYKTRPDGKERLLTKGSLKLEDRVEVGSNCTIDRGVSGETRIGADTKLDNLIQIGHDTIVGERCIIASQVGIAGVCNIEDDVIIWGQAGIAKGVTIGKGAIIYAKTGVMSSLKGGQTYFGYIATPYRQKLREFASIKKLPELLKKWLKES